MGLFDILRFQGTDLGSREALEALPEELITQYWIQAHKTHPEYVYPDHRTMCNQLANWGHDDCNPKNHYARDIFNRVLKEYNP
jgi:hypothetical protein